MCILRAVIAISIGVFAVIMSDQAIADWSMISNSKKESLYFDGSRVQKSGYKSKLWTLSDLANPEPYTSLGKLFLSLVTQSEFDCKEFQTRVIYIAFFTGKMGTGETIFASTIDQEWNPIPPGSTSDALLKIACNYDN